MNSRYTQYGKIQTELRQLSIIPQEHIDQKAKTPCVAFAKDIQVTHLHRKQSATNSYSKSPLSRCNFQIVYGLKTACSIRTDRTNRRPGNPLDSGKKVHLMRCNFQIVYGLKTAYSICTDRTDRQPVKPPSLQ